MIYTECCGANAGCGADNTCCVNDAMGTFFQGATRLAECRGNRDCCNPGSICQINPFFPTVFPPAICECYPLGYYITHI